MVNAGAATLLLIVFGPVAYRKAAEWRHQRKLSAERQRVSRPDAGSILNRLPLPIALPSNALVAFAFLSLIAYHLSALLLPSRYAMRTDLFLLLHQPLNTSTVVLRALLEKTSHAQIGWLSRWTDEGLTTLLRRLGSWDGRKVHLLIGIDPFVTCGFCDSSRDYVYYSIATRVAQYGIDMFLLGILTLRFDALNTIDDVVFLVVQLTSGIDLAPDKPTNTTTTLRPHRFQWRATVKYFMAIFAVCELIVLSGFYEIGLNQGRWSHWHANRNIVWHAAIPLLASIILISPRMPHVPALVQIVQSLHRTETMSAELRSNLHASHLSQRILWQDEDMRKRVAEFYTNEDDDGHTDDDTDEVVEQLARYAQAARVDVAQLRLQARQAAHAIWLNSERVWEEPESSK